MDSENQTIITTNIPVSYETDDVKVSFNIEFGKGKEGSLNSTYRTNYNAPYDIEKHTIDNKDMYCLLAEEGPFVMNVSDVYIIPKKSKQSNTDCKYGITTVMDLNKQPEYNSQTSFTPSNDIERDGQPWIIFNGHSHKIDQNGQAMFQWSTAKALDKGVKPTAEQEMMGVEERHENSGMIYITFQPIFKEEERPVLTRGIASGADRGYNRGLTRGFQPSHAARVGYGDRAETNSKSTSVKAFPDSRFILPIRIRIIGETSPNVKCAKNLQCAMRVEELQKRTAVLPDY